MNKLSKLKNTVTSAVGAIIFLCFGSASATIVETKMVGHIATISAPLQNKGMAVGDPFELSFTFDNSLGITTSVTAGGLQYSLVTQTFQIVAANWFGSLPTYMASTIHEPIWVNKDSWFRPTDTLHHEEWNVGGLYLITNYQSNPVPSYGWFHWSQPDSVGIIIDSAVTGPIVTSPIPEPESYAMLLAGLGLLGFMIRRKNKVLY